MSKQWVHFADNKMESGSTPRREKSFSDAIRNIKPRTVEEMKKESDAGFAAMKQEEAKLMEAFEQKKLKSKTAIKQALAIKKAREKAAKKAEAKKAKGEFAETA